MGSLAPLCLHANVYWKVIDGMRQTPRQTHGVQLSSIPLLSHFIIFYNNTVHIFMLPFHLSVRDLVV